MTMYTKQPTIYVTLVLMLLLCGVAQAQAPKKISFKSEFDVIIPAKWAKYADQKKIKIEDDMEELKFIVSNEVEVHFVIFKTLGLAAPVKDLKKAANEMLKRRGHNISKEKRVGYLEKMHTTFFKEGTMKSEGKNIRECFFVGANTNYALSLRVICIDSENNAKTIYKLVNDIKARDY